MKVVLAKQMKDLDGETIASGVSGQILMERAGTGAFQEILSFISNWDPRHVRHFIVLAGKGNNGGDGYVIARLISERTKFKVSIYSVCPKDDLKGDAYDNAIRLPAKILVKVCSRLPDDCFTEGTIFIDCLLGTGINGPVKEPYLTFIKQVNKNDLPVIAADVPSGINADNGAIENEAMNADLTVTMGLPKKGLFMGNGRRHCGQLRLVEIGILKNLIDGTPSTFDTVFRQDIGRIYKRLPKEIHKASMGKILIVGGSERFPGAPILAGLGALRAGGGLVAVAYPKSIAPLIHPKENALILTPFEDQGTGYHGAQNPDQLVSLISDKDVLVVGPGLAREALSIDLVKQLLTTEKTVILDADGLHAFVVDQQILPRKGITILTPHPGEMGRLIDALSLNHLRKEDRITQAKSIATKLKTYIVLKGPETVIATPAGEVAVNTSGTPALATGGTGDVLAGMIAAHVCQFQDTLAALKSAVFVHGLAAELTQRGMRNFIADDLLPNIGVALKDITPFA